MFVHHMLVVVRRYNSKPRANITMASVHYVVLSASVTSWRVGA